MQVGNAALVAPPAKHRMEAAVIYSPGSPERRVALPAVWLVWAGI